MSQKEEYIIPTDPAVLEKIRKALSEISDSKLKMEAHRDHIKAVVETISEDTKIPRSEIVRLANIFHKDNFDRVVAQQDQFETLYFNVVNAKPEQ